MPLLSGVAVAEIYSWVDEDGERHFSDTPQEGSEQVELGPTNTFSSPAPVASAPAAGETDAEAEEEPAYNDFEFTSPTPDQVLWNTGGVVPVSMALIPRLQSDHRIQLTMDGQPVAGYQGRSLSHQLTGMERGTHSLRAAVVGPDGNPLIQAQPVRFTVQQRSIQNPAPRGGL